MQGMRKKCVAMLLAGGQGSRLGVLTKHTAKPAVPFGGKYRIIDFPLSNCVNSGLDTVGIMTQYQPLELNDYIGNGRPWGLNRSFGGVHVLPPYAKSKKSEWYKGTANAIYQNIHFVDRYDPDYVIVLSGDHIYKMDYSKMLDYHKETGSECTIAVFDVPLSEASRFGIMNLNEDGSIYEFEEKPKNPKSTKASMGIYIFNWQLLKEYLIADEKNPESSNDFGKDIIPKLLGDGKKLYAYLFEGYWKDVGTIESLWEANMDLLDPEIPIQLKDPDFKIFARNYAKPSSFIASSAVIDNSFVSEGCVIKGRASNSVVSVGCEIEDGAIVENSVIMPNTIIKKGASVKYSIIGENCIIGENAVVGTNDKKISVIGHNKVVPDGAAVSGQEVKL